MKRILAIVLALMLVAGCGNGAVSSSSAPAPVSPESNTSDIETTVPTETKRGENTEKSYPDAVNVALSDDGITVDGKAVSTDSESDIYVANDIIFYLANQGFTYGEGEKDDEHEQSEADGHTVLHITKPGKYLISGTLSTGQIAVDLGKEAEDDPNAVVTLILDGIDVTCTVAPGVIFYNVYECGDDDEETATRDVDTSAAGANVIIADGSVNNVNGSYVARIYKSYTLSEDGTKVVDNKKLHKYDGAFYSKMSMNINGGEKGDGILHINAENEGLDSELHLTVNGGNIYIKSGNDGINTNEDYVSVTTVNGGLVDINVTGETGEGDGIDSNGWLVINGGEVVASACSNSADSGIDSDMGIYLNGGSVCATGNMLDRISGGNIPYAVFTFSERQKGGTTYTLKSSDGKSVGEWTPENDFSILIVGGGSIVDGTYTLWSGDTQFAGSAGMGGFGGGFGGFGGFGGGMPPEGFDPENMQMPEMPEGMEFPEGMTPPEWHDGKFPEMPEGMERPDNMKRPEGDRQMGGKGQKGGFGNNGNIDPSQLDTEFEITAEGSYFTGVSEVKTTTTV